MFGLERDFVQQDGITMLLGKPEGLSAEELNMVQTRMLMNTGIPHHLRLLLREIDLQVRLEYAVARRKMLGTMLKSGSLSMMEFFGLMLQIAAGMEEGRLYMLRAEQYVLHEDYIFIEGTLGSGKVFLTYVPLQDIGLAARPGESLKALIMVFMAAIQELSGGGLQRLLHYCGEDEFSPAGLKALLAELLTGGEARRVSPETSGPAPMSNPAADRRGYEQSPVRIREELEPRLLEKVPFSWNQGGIKDSESSVQVPDSALWPGGAPRLKRKETMPGESLGGDLPEQPPTDGASPYRTYLILGAVLGDALLWKFLYLNDPRKLWLIVCAAVTLGLTVVCWMVWSGRIAWGGSEAEDDLEEDDLKAGNSGRNSGMRKPGSELEWDFGRNPVVPLRSPASSQPLPEQKSLKEADDLAGKGAGWMMSDSAGMSRGCLQAKEQAAATALLTREPVPDKGGGSPQNGRAAPYLERTCPDDGGIPERVELNRPSFIIGRSAEVAQYVEKSEGASRVHAEISRSSGGYILKDLDSRNGTILAGEVMVPYKEYPLTEGTVFTIVKGSYTFHN